MMILSAITTVAVATADNTIANIRDVVVSLTLVIIVFFNSLHVAAQCRQLVLFLTST